MHAHEPATDPSGTASRRSVLRGAAATAWAVPAVALAAPTFAQATSNTLVPSANGSAFRRMGSTLSVTVAFTGDGDVPASTTVALTFTGITATQFTELSGSYGTNLTPTSGTISNGAVTFTTSAAKGTPLAFIITFSSANGIRNITATTASVTFPNGTPRSISLTRAASQD